MQKQGGIPYIAVIYGNLEKEASPRVFSQRYWCARLQLFPVAAPTT